MVDGGGLDPAYAGRPVRTGRNLQLVFDDVLRLYIAERTGQRILCWDDGQY